MLYFRCWVIAFNPPKKNNLNIIEENTFYTLMKFDENCPKRKPSNSQVHVYAVITFQFEKNPIKLDHELSFLGRKEHELILFYRIFSGLVPTQRSLQALYFS